MYPSVQGFDSLLLLHQGTGDGALRHLGQDLDFTNGESQRLEIFVLERGTRHDLPEEPATGEKIELADDKIKLVEIVPSGEVYVDGIGVGDVGNIVLNDRKHLSMDGIIIVVATIDSSTGQVISGPDIVSRGFVYVRENEALMNSARDLACRVIDENYNVKFHDWNAVKSGLRDELSRLMYERTKRRPMILPILMEI